MNPQQQKSVYELKQALKKRGFKEVKEVDSTWVYRVGDWECEVTIQIQQQHFKVISDTVDEKKAIFSLIKITESSKLYVIAILEAVGLKINEEVE